jgi:hypothetical protein
VVWPGRRGACTGQVLLTPSKSTPTMYIRQYQQKAYSHNSLRCQEAGNCQVGHQPNHSRSVQLAPGQPGAHHHQVARKADARLDVNLEGEWQLHMAGLDLGA